MKKLFWRLEEDHRNQIKAMMKQHNEEIIQIKSSEKAECNKLMGDFSQNSNEETRGRNISTEKSESK